MSKTLKKIGFRHTCAKCGRERRIGTLMYWERVIEDGKIKHVHTCKECPDNRAKKINQVELPYLGAI